MSSRLHVLTFTAGQTQILPQGRYWFIKSASVGALDIEMVKRSGQPNSVTNIGAGAKFNGLETDRWYELRITSASIQVVEFYIGDDATLDFTNAVSIVGTAAFAEAPSTVLTSTSDVNINNATTNTASIPANPLRKRVTVGALAANTGNIRLIDLTGNFYIELQPGMFVELKTTANVRVRNDSGATQQFYSVEET